MKEDNLYSPSCRALVCVTFCMNVTAGREFLGLHPFFAPKNGWNIKQQFGLFFFLYVHFFYFNTARKSCAFDLACLYSKRYSIVLNRVLEQKRKKRTKEREKPVFTKEILKLRNENFRPLSKYNFRYGKFSFLCLKISNRIPSGLRPEPPTAYKVGRYFFLSGGRGMQPYERKRITDAGEGRQYTLLAK